MDWSNLLSGLRVLSSLTLTNCHLSGTLDSFGTSTWSQQEPGRTHRLDTVNLANNFLSGSLPANMLQSCRGAIFFTLDNNLFSGDLPGSMLSYLSVGWSTLNLYLSGNYFAGTIPPDFLSYTPAGIEIRISVSIKSSGLLGPLPSSPFFGIPANNSLQTIQLDFESNSLSGSIPTNWFRGLNLASLRTMVVDMHDNSLTGGLPDGFLTFSADALSAFFSFSENPTMTGSISPTLFSTAGNGTDGNVWDVQISADSTGLTGALIIGKPSRSSPIKFSLSFQQADLNFLSIDPDAAVVLQGLTLTGNTGLFGTITDSLFNSSSLLERFECGGTRLSGTMPNIGSSDARYLKSLILSGTDVDFCYTTKTTWTAGPAFTSGCNLQDTSAYNCTYLYPGICTFSAPSPREPAVIVFPPFLLPPTVVTNPVDSPTIPMRLPTQACSPATQPSPSFTCENGIWVLIGSLTAPVLTIPSGASQTVIVGNLTATSITISGLGSTLVLESGCPMNVTSVTVELSESDIKSIGSSKRNQTLIITDSDCSSLNNITVLTKIKSSCSKVKAEKTSSSRTLTALFSVSQSSCRSNRWWVILIAVVIPVVVIIVIIILLVTLVPSVRRVFRPFSVRGHRAKQRS